MFVVRQEKNARQTISLSCVEVKTHNKQFFAERFFLPCAMEKTLCRAPEKKTHGKDFHARQTRVFT
jgi:hypothetical protein